MKHVAKKRGTGDSRLRAGVRETVMEKGRGSAKNLRRRGWSSGSHGRRSPSVTHHAGRHLSELTQLRRQSAREAIRVQVLQHGGRGGRSQHVGDVMNVWSSRRIVVEWTCGRRVSERCAEANRCAAVGHEARARRRENRVDEAGRVGHTVDGRPP